MSSDLRSSIASLDAALDRLQVVVERRKEGDLRSDTLESDVQALSADRARLADRLDKAEARASSLEDANKDVSQRIVGAMESIRSAMTADSNGA
ncbi:MAG: DUF4164 family protein [Alphaproteobacteria bacterium]